MIITSVLHKAKTLSLLALIALWGIQPCAGQNDPRMVGMGPGHDSIAFESIVDAGLLVVDVQTIGNEWPTCDYVSAPEGSWGRSIANATRVPGRVRVWKAGQVAFDSGDFVQDAHGATIRIRGNTSAYYNKKPYKIDLQDKGDLLLRNNPNYRDKDWLLICDEYFKTMQGLELNRYLDMSWTPAYRYVNLVVNNEYLGLYMLVESVKRNTNCRINIAKDGFLFEHDAYWWNTDFYITSTLNDARHYTFKYPSASNLTAADIEYIGGVINDYEQSVADGTYPDYIDVESFASWCLGHDILATFDAAGTNSFYTKANRQPGTLVTMPLMWDFDSSEADSTRWSRCHNINCSKLFRSHNRDFVIAYATKWKQIRANIVNDMRNVLQRYKSTADGLALPRSMQLNNTRWDLSLLSLGSIDLRAQWFADRFNWLDNAIAQLMPKGDVNADGRVDINDVNLLVNMILELSPADVENADLTGDERVDVADLNTLISIILAESPIEHDTLELSAHRVDISPSGGTAFVDVTASGQWAIEPGDIPEWLNAEPTMGDAGGTTIIFAANSTMVDRSAQLRIVCGEITDTITVAQSISQRTDTLACIADFLNANPGLAADSCTLTGVVTDIELVRQGRITLRDWSGSVFVSGVMRQPEFKQLKVGDIATIGGSRVVYNDVPQLVAAQFDTIIAVRRIEIADFVANPDTSTDYLMLSGTISQIDNDQFAVLYITDADGNTVFVDGVAPGWGASGDARCGLIEAYGIAVGQQITIVGHRMADQGQPTLTDAFYFAHSQTKQQQ